MNPARTFGPALAAHHWINHGVYWVGPLFGGLLGAVVYDRLFAPRPVGCLVPRFTVFLPALASK